jgi:hypothetical protein
MSPMSSSNGPQTERQTDRKEAKVGYEQHDARSHRHNTDALLQTCYFAKLSHASTWLL